MEKKMNYIEEAIKTDIISYEPMRARLQDKTVMMILHALMGITTECGELMDALKKHLIYGKPIDFTNLLEEHGDLQWYLALLAYTCDFTFEIAQERNIEKLRARFPEKFTEFDALNRNLEKERKILEGE